MKYTMEEYYGVFPFTSENINRQIQYFAKNESERHAVLNGRKEVNND